MRARNSLLYLLTLLKHCSALAALPLALAVALALVFGLSTVAQSHELCQYVFSHPPLVSPMMGSVALIKLHREIRERSRETLQKLMSSPILTKQGFNKDLFQKELDYYRNAKEFDRVPETPEAMLALIEAAGERNAKSFLNTGEWLKSTNPLALKRLRTEFTRLRNADQIEELYARVYLLTHTDPRLDPRFFVEMISKPIPQAVRRLITQRFEMEMGADAAREAFEKLGVFQNPKVRLRIIREMKKRPNVISKAFTLMINIISLKFFGSPLHVAQHSFLSTKLLSIEQKELLRRELEQSQDPNVPLRLLRSAKFDVAWYWIRRGVMLSLMAYVTGHLLQEIIDDELNPIDDSLQFLEGAYNQTLMLYEVHEATSNSELDSFADDPESDFDTYLREQSLNQTQARSQEPTHQ